MPIPRRPLLLAALCAVLPVSALADDAADASFPRSGGYAGLTGGAAFGGNARSDDWDNRDLKYRDSLEAGAGWGGTAEGGVILPLGRVQWLRLRVGLEAGHQAVSLDPSRDGFSGDVVDGDVRINRLGAAAAVDFDIAGPLSFTAGLSGGPAWVSWDATVANGATVTAFKDRQTTPYASLWLGMNVALADHWELVAGYRATGMSRARVAGTATLLGGGTYAVEHRLEYVGGLEAGLRFTF